jgi:hypothetical protein
MRFSNIAPGGTAVKRIEMHEVIAVSDYTSATNGSPRTGRPYRHLLQEFPS